MPRRRATPPPTADAEGFQLPGMSDLDQDPTPAAAVPRQTRRATKATGARKIASRSPSTGRIQTKAAQIKQAEAEIQTYLILANAAWSMRDPECAAVAEAQIPDITARLVAILGRNDALLSVITKTGIVGDIIGLLTATLPIARAVWSAHGPGGIGHDREAADNAHERYPAHAY